MPTFLEPNLSEEEFIKRAPKTMGTQHPDNSFPVPFGKTAYVPNYQEGDEIFWNFYVLRVNEHMHDLEGKAGDLRPLKTLLKDHTGFFTKNPIGERFYITPRLPNPRKSANDPNFYQGIGIFSNSLLVLNYYKLQNQAFYEFIIPDTTEGLTIALIEQDINNLYQEKRTQFKKYTGKEFPSNEDFKVQGITLIEDVESLRKPEEIYDRLIEERKKRLGKDTFTQSTMIAGSDPPLKAGKIPGTLAGVLALSQGVSYEQSKGVLLRQILGVGAAPMRGGLDLDNIDAVLETYPGVTTFTLQSAFRYDSSQREVSKAIKTLEEKVQERWLNRGKLVRQFSSEEIESIKNIFNKFKINYQSSINEVYDLAWQLFEHIPSHRDRDTAGGPQGYGRDIGGKRWPRAIKTNAIFASLGIPLSLIGSRTFYELKKEERILIKESIPMIAYWLVQELDLLNEDNLRNINISNINQDIESAKSIVSEFESENLVPKQFSLEILVDDKHAEYTSEILHILKKIPRTNQDEDELKKLILQSAQHRGWLG